MEPVSVIGLTGPIIGIVDVAARSISAVRILQQRWKLADLTIILLISQLTTPKAAMSQIEVCILNPLEHESRLSIGHRPWYLPRELRKIATFH